MHHNIFKHRKVGQPKLSAYAKKEAQNQKIKNFFVFIKSNTGLVAILISMSIALIYFYIWIYNYGRFLRLGISSKLLDTSNQFGLNTFIFLVVMEIPVWAMVYFIRESSRRTKLTIVLVVAVANIIIVFVTYRNKFSNSHEIEKQILLVIILSLILLAFEFFVYFILALYLRMISKPPKVGKWFDNLPIFNQILSIIILAVIAAFAVNYCGYKSSVINMWGNCQVVYNKREMVVDVYKSNYIVVPYDYNPVKKMIKIQTNTYKIIPMADTSIATIEIKSYDNDNLHW